MTEPVKSTLLEYVGGFLNKLVLKTALLISV